MRKEETDIIILGAGAAGLLCAYFCSMEGKSVTVLEHNEKVGKKILISGGGRCNFTNIYSNSEDFVSQNKHFCKSALKRFGPYDFIKLIEDANIEYYEKKLGQLFCVKKSSDVVAMLLNLIQQKNIKLILNAKELSVDFSQDRFVLSNDSLSIDGENLVVASGGLSIEPIGASDIGHKIGKKFGHKIVPATPALVPFKCSGFNELAGHSMLVKVKVGNEFIQEELLFTHKGLSGPAILKISLFWNVGDKIEIDFLPDQNILSLLKEAPGKNSLYSFFKKLFSQKFTDNLFEKLFLDKNSKIADLKKDTSQNIRNYLHQNIVIPTSTEGFRKAEVTKGGVDTAHISSKTMESQIQKGLFFIGEVLDVTGQLGGHNFQWAWASAYAAGTHLAKS